jgi:hypothetical protein
MKRKREQSPEYTDKRSMHQMAPISALSNDEMSHILTFLTVGETLMLAMSDKTLYETITNVVKSRLTITLTEPWAITKALRADQKLEIRSKYHADLLKKIINRGELSKLTSSIEFNQRGKETINMDDASELFSFKGKGTVKVQAIDFEKKKEGFASWDDENDVTVYDKSEHELPVVAGFDIKHLKVSAMEGNSDALYKLLSKMINLESIELEGMDESFMSIKSKTKTPKKVDHWTKKKYVGVKLIQVEKSANMKQVIENADLEYQSGKGYYQLTKKESVTDKKKIIVIDESEHTMWRDEDALGELGITKKSKFDLNIRDGYVIFVQSTSHNRKLPALSYVLYETDDMTIDDEEEQDAEEDEEENTIVLPVLNKLKKLHLHVFDYDTGDSYVTRLLQVAPNLEDFKYVYDCSPSDVILEFIAEHNPKLKRIHIEGDDGATPSETAFTDDAILNLISKTQLEEITLNHSASVSGELLKTIGQYERLKSFILERNAYNGDLVEQANDVHFGGGVLSNLKEIVICGCWTDLQPKYAETMIQVAPNVKILNLRDHDEPFPTAYQTMLIKAYDLEELHLQSRVYNQHNSDTTEHRQELIKAIMEKKNLRRFYYGYSESPFLTIDQLKECSFPRLRLYHGPLQKDIKWLEAFQQACPNLTEIKTDTKLESIEIFKNEKHWPELRFCSFKGDNKVEFSKLRPLVSMGTVGRCDYERVRKRGKMESIEEFTRNWLQADFLDEY